MTETYTVNRLFKNKRPTKKVVLNQSNRGPSDAIKYGQLIESKETFGGTWIFVGIVQSEIKNASEFSQNGGIEDTDLLKKGINVISMRKSVKLKRIEL